MGPILVFDKSLLQSLNPDESLWLDQFFLTNITPLFFIETLADLEKEVGRGRTPEHVVGALAAKTPDLHSHPNMHHWTLLAGELSGRASIEVGEGKPIIGGGRKSELEGATGVVFQPPPEAEAFRRWKDGEFLDLERQQAKRWRNQLGLIDPARQRELFSGWFGELRPKTLAEIKSEVDAYIDGPDAEAVLTFGLRLLGIRPTAIGHVLTRWKVAGNPAIKRFLPYFRHLFGVELFFYLGLGAGLISERRTNKVDIAYLYYLPFCMVFTSSDKLHGSTVPLFLRANQSFVPGVELKSDLAALDRHFDALPEAEKRAGLYSFASRPPTTPDFLVARLWDRHLSPRWRERVSKPGNGETPESDPRLIELVRKRFEASRDSAAGPLPSLDEVDYIGFKRKVSLRRGKWNRFPPEVVADA